MYEREISKSQVISVIETGTIITEYPNDTPYPSYLLNGVADKKHLHLVIAVDHSSSNCYIVTVYIPNSAQWTDNHQTRKKI